MSNLPVFGPSQGPTAQYSNVSSSIEAMDLLLEALVFRLKKLNREQRLSVFEYLYGKSPDQTLTIRIYANPTKPVPPEAK